MRIALLLLALAGCATAPLRPKPDCHTVPAGVPCDGVATVAPVSFTVSR